ncbi:ATP-binding cassette subfamily G member 4-like isoform X2 [Chironomus tepperi]|uniref:ATP-binding cassette subfamily G member 4-like isoform X2 n=1 Tax=Chironomus tepperi TaxID=113505 RepID=UPI00391F7A80
MNLQQLLDVVEAEQTLHIYLTVNELMNFAINVKLKQKLSNQEKEIIIDEILDKLNIKDRLYTLVGDLSGGERKRFQIAIELVGDPKILFLDEPTTNLDIVASTQCIKYLKNITKEGRTIIITIHQPSAIMLDLFDHIYALNNGYCIFQGSSKNLLNFFDCLGLSCPSTYNSTDYLMEIANNEYGDHSHLLVEKTKNGLNMEYSKKHETIDNSKDIFTKSSDFTDYSATYFRQVYCLTARFYLSAMRNRTLIYVRFLVHILIAIFLGLIYQKVGNNGSFALDNYHLILVSTTVILYTSYHSHYATFPLEFSIIKREYFNGWYSAAAYHSSLIISDAPILFLNVTIFVTIVYLMTGQVLEIDRYLMFLGFFLIFSYTSQALAIMFTSLLNAQVALLIASNFLIPFFSMSIMSIFARDTIPLFRPFFELNFFNMGIKGAVISIFGFNRTRLDCDEIYCHFNDPKKILRDFECEIDVMQSVYTLIIYYIICQIVSVIFINYRLKYRYQ